LIRPLGFAINEATLKRSGLDYWHELDVTIYDDMDDFTTKNPDANIYYVETCAVKSYDKVTYKPGDFLMFGKETAGLPKKLTDANYEKCIRLPMLEGARSFNLSVAAGIVVYEAMRQNGFGECK